MIDPGRVNAITPIELVCSAPSDELLLVDWLNTLIYEMSVRSMQFSDFSIEMEDGQPAGHLERQLS